MKVNRRVIAMRKFALLDQIAILAFGLGLGVSQYVLMETWNYGIGHYGRLGVIFAVVGWLASILLYGVAFFAIRTREAAYIASKTGAATPEQLDGQSLPLWDREMDS